MKIKRIFTSLIALFMIFIITGCGNTKTEKRSSELLTPSEAREIALKDAKATDKESIFTLCELEKDKKIEYYQVEFFAGTVEYEYEINAKTGEIISADKEEVKETNETLSYTIPPTTVSSTVETVAESVGNSSEPNTGASYGVRYISRDEVKKIALKHAKVKADNTTFDSIELDFDNGVTYYDVEFKSGKTEYNYEIDAITGEIISSEKDNENIVN